MEEAIFGFVGALLGVALGFIGTVLSTFGKSKDTQLDVITKIITNERAQWRSDMRTNSAELISLLFQLESEWKDDLARDFQIKRVEIRFRLNPKEGHKLDEELLSILKEFSLNVTNKDLDKNNLTSKLEKFELAMQNLIKNEWDKSKKEAESGFLGKSDASV